MSPKSSDADEANPNPTFDQSLGRLEQIVVELEGGGLGLESSLERYKEGVGLLKGCRDRLSAFRAQVEELKPDGSVMTSGPSGSGPGANRQGANRAGAAPGGRAPEGELDTPF